MAIISNLSPSKIFRGQGTRLYMNPTFNNDGSVTLTNGGLDSVGHPTAKDLGYLSEDGVQFVTTPTYEDLPVLNSDEPILFGLLSRVSSIKFKGLQVRDYAIWQKIVPATALLSGTGLTGIGDDVVDIVTPFSLVAIAPTQNDQTKSYYLTAYSGYNIAAYNLDFLKKWNMTSIEMKLLDSGRTSAPKSWALWEQS